MPAASADSALPRPFRGRPLLVALGLAVIAVAVHWNALGVGFVYGDRVLVGSNPLIGSLRSLPQIFTTGYWGGRLPGIGNYRPLALATFALDRSIWGIEPVGFHLTNLVLHALVSLAVFGVLRRLIGRLLPAALAAGLFALHPVHTEAVIWINGRPEILAALFSLLAWTGYLRAREADAGHRALPWAASCAAFLAALLSKENAGALPLGLVLTEIALRRPQRNAALAPASGTLATAGESWASVGLRIAPYLGVLALYLALRYAVLGALGVSPELQALAGQNLLGRLATFGNVLILYARLLVFPHPLSLDYGTLPVVGHVVSLQGGRAVAFLVAWAAAGVILYRRGHGLAGLGLLWIPALLAPVSNLVPTMVVAAERFLYLPSVGFCLLFGLGAERGLRAAGGRRLLAAAAAVLVFLAASAGTWARARGWQDEASLWKAELARHPDRADLWNVLGSHYLNQKQLPEAEKALQEAIRRAPELAPAHNDLGMAYTLEGRHEEALGEFQTAIRLRSTNPQYHQNLAMLYDLMKQPAEAIPEYVVALQLNPREVLLRYLLALDYARVGRLDEARAALEIFLGEWRGDPRYRDSAEQLRQGILNRQGAPGY